MWTDFQNFFTDVIRKKILYVYIVHHKDFHVTCNMLPHYLVKFENPSVTEFSC